MSLEKQSMYVSNIERNLKYCRICLGTNVSETRSPHFACYICYRQLQKCKQLVTKSQKAEELLKQVSENWGELNEKTISMIDRRACGLLDTMIVGQVETMQVLDLNDLTVPETVIKQENVSVKEEPAYVGTSMPFLYYTTEDAWSPLKHDPDSTAGKPLQSSDFIGSDTNCSEIDKECTWSEGSECYIDLPGASVSQYGPPSKRICPGQNPGKHKNTVENDPSSKTSQLRNQQNTCHPLDKITQCIIGNSSDIDTEDINIDSNRPVLEKGNIKKEREVSCPEEPNVQFLQCDNCSFKCTERFSPEERNTLFRQYYNMDSVSRKSFVLSCIKITMSNSNKDLVTSYFLKQGDDHVEVCLKFLKATLYVTDYAVNSAAKKAYAEFNNKRKRGKRIAANERHLEDTAFVKRHIESFPVEFDGDNKYLAPDVKSMNDMYQIYKDVSKNSGRDTLSIYKYREIFNKYSLNFYLTKKGCNICSKYGDRLKNTEEYRKHLKLKKCFQTEKDGDKERANEDDSFMSITIDVQVLHIPKGKDLHHMRKLLLYNFTIYESKLPNNAYCFCWTEIDGANGSCEIGTCLYYYLKALPTSIKEISIFSDTHERNGNKEIAALMFWAVQKIDHLYVIQQKFLENGHTRVEGEFMHMAIEEASKNEKIASVSDWIKVITKAREKTTVNVTKDGVNQSIDIDNYKVKELGFNDMLDLKNMRDEIIIKEKDMVETIDWAKVLRIKYVKGELKIYYNYDMTENFRNISCVVAKAETDNPVSVGAQLPHKIKHLYSEQLPISKSKKKDLLKMCSKDIIPEEYHAWVHGMKTFDEQMVFSEKK